MSADLRLVRPEDSKGDVAKHIVQEYFFYKPGASKESYYNIVANPREAGIINWGEDPALLEELAHFMTKCNKLKGATLEEIALHVGDASISILVQDILKRGNCEGH